jgi:SAM-dependent methyltransferase
MDELKQAPAARGQTEADAEPAAGASVASVRARRDWMVANADPGPCAHAVRAHLAGYSTDQQIEAWITLYRDVVVPAIPNFPGSTGVDFGCWTGLGTSILASFGAARVFAAELNAETMRFGPRWAQHFGLDALRFVWNARGVVPLPDAAVDWVYVNQVFCNMPPDGFDQAIGQIARLLKPGGVLVLCDSNNPHCPATLERLERVYRTRELGDGDEARPAGALYTQRLRRVLELAPDAAPEDAARVAANTCYLGGAELDRAILRWRLSGVEPASPFRGGWWPAPVNPKVGIAAGNITDPFDLASRLGRAGFDTTINTSAAPGPTDPAELLERMTGSQSFYILGKKRDNL